MDSFLIRKIGPRDNLEIEHVIKAISPEFNMPTAGTAFQDKETLGMFESYQNDNEICFVVEELGKVVGGGGIKPLRDFENDVCELQKMYLAPKARGKGHGELLFTRCLEEAKDPGYKKCCLESASQLKAAIQIYEKQGFQHLGKPLGIQDIIHVVSG